MHLFFRDVPPSVTRVSKCFQHRLYKQQTFLSISIADRLKLLQFGIMATEKLRPELGLLMSAL